VGCSGVGSQPNICSAETPILRLFRDAASKRLKPGEALFDSELRPRGCFLLDHGCLKVSFPAPDGTDRIVDVLSKGALVGDVLEWTEAGSVVALTLSDLRYVSRSCFDLHAQNCPEVLRAIAGMLARRLIEKERKLSVLLSSDAKTRVADALLTLGENLGEPSGPNEILITEMIPQSELAAMAGVARENVNRLLKSWERQKLLRREGRAYCIDERGLRREAALDGEGTSGAVSKGIGQTNERTRYGAEGVRVHLGPSLSRE
jgi:CRP/FNR family transcriptional regulator, cyclic AMP receptor protein